MTGGRKYERGGDMRYYYVLDTETTGFSPKKDAMIEIAAIKVQEGRITDRFHTFVNPGRPIPEEITELTGIRDEDVYCAPDIDAAAMNLARFLSDGYPVVGHNITFDMGFIQAAFVRLGMSADFRLVDTLSLARRAFPGLPDYKLDTLISRLNLADHEQMHRAMDDVMITNALFWECLRKLAPRDEDMYVVYKAAPKQRRTPRRAKLQPTVTTVDTTNPFYGKSVVLTGELSIPRDEVKQIIVNCGGAIKPKVTTRTDYLIIGKRDEKYAAIYGKSGKEKQADALNAEGLVHIECLNEQAFFRMVPITAIPEADGIAIGYELEEANDEYFV